MARGKSGSSRRSSGGRRYAGAMQNHEDRLDHNGPMRQISNTPALIWSPHREGPGFDWRKIKREEHLKWVREMIRAKPPGKSNFTIWDSLEEHRKGARVSKAARQDFLHMFCQFPTDLPIESEDDERALLAHAVDFVNSAHGGDAVFHARLDRDEKGRHGVDVFYAPKYEKQTASKGVETWVSLSKHSKEHARQRFGQRQKTRKNKAGEDEPVLDAKGQEVMVWNDSPHAQGRAMQDLFYEYLRDEMKLDFVVRGEKKKTRDPDWKTPEQIAAAREAEKELAAIRAEAENAALERQRATQELAGTKQALKAAQALLEPLRAAYAALLDWQARRPMSPEERLEKAEAEHLAARRARRDATPAEQERRAAEFEKAEMAAKQEVAQCRAEAGMIVEFVAHEGFTPGRPARKCGETGEALILCRDAKTGDEVQVYIPEVNAMAAVSSFKSIGEIHPRVHREHASMIATLKALRPGDFLHILKPVAHDFIEKAIRCYSMIRCDPPRYGATPPPEAKPFADLPTPVQEAMKAAFDAEAEIAPSASPGP